MGWSLRIACVAVSCSWACVEPLDTTRQTPDRGTLGEEIFGLFARDYTREDPRKAEGFGLAKEGLVDAIDHLVPPDELWYTQQILVDLLPLYDEELLPNTTRNLSDALDRLAQDEEALRSLTALGYRTGYVDLRHEEALIQRIAQYPKYRELTRALVGYALKNDGKDRDGALDPNENDAVVVLQRLLADRLADFEISQDEERDLVLMVDLLLSEDPRLDESDDDVYVVARDARGLPKVRMVGQNLMGPFVDLTPADGLADVALDGRFIDAAGRPIALAPFDPALDTRDEQGRPVTDGNLIFDYVNVDRTLLAGLLRDGRSLIRDDLPMKAVRSFDTVLGERTPEGTYSPINSPMLDLVHATSASADLTDLPDLVELLHTLVEHHEPTAMWTVLELQDQLDIADRYQNVNLESGNDVFNEMMSWIRKVIREPGLAEDLLVALQDPRVAQLSEATRLGIIHKKDRLTREDYDNGTVFEDLVDRSQPDVAGNHSLVQRMLHLMYDTRGARYEPRFIGIPIGFIFEIDDLAEFYILSFIGVTEVPGIVSTLTGLPRNPTPLDLATFLNQDQDFGNPEGNEGIDVKDNDGDVLFAVAASGMDQGLAPLVQVFYDHGQMPLFFELFDILHLNWASKDSDYQPDPGTPRYSKLSGIRRFEPMLADVFTETKVLESAQKLLTETNDLRVDSGKRGHDLILAAARKIIAKDTNLRTRDGSRTVFVDGERITPLSPFDLIRAGLDGIDTEIDRRTITRTEWDEVSEALTDVFLQTERVGPEAGRLQNRRAVPVTAHLLAFLEDRLRTHDAKGELSDWIQNDMLQVAEDALTSEELPALFDVIYALDEEPAVDAAVSDLRDELLDEERGFFDLLVTVADGAAAAKDATVMVPFVRYLGRELHPDQGHVFSSLTLANRSMQLDEDEHLLEVFRRALDRSEVTGELHAYGIAKAVRQAQRVDPLSTKTPDLEDMRRIIHTTRDYLVDDEHGLGKVYDLVQNRKQGSAAP